MKATICINVDTDSIESLEDSYLAALWHASQATSAPAASAEAGQLADQIATEIVRRWLGSVRPMLYERSLERSYWETLHQHGCWDGPGGSWKPRSGVDSTAAAPSRIALVGGGS